MKDLLVGDIGDISRFASRGHFASWNGTADGHRRQGGADGSGRTRGGDSAIQRGRPDPHGRHFGQVTSRTRRFTDYDRGQATPVLTQRGAEVHPPRAVTTVISTPSTPTPGTLWASRRGGLPPTRVSLGVIISRYERSIRLYRRLGFDETGQHVETFDGYGAVGSSTWKSSTAKPG